MRFATHMYGNGVGMLRVKIRYVGGEEEIPDKIVWEMNGEAGNNWYLGQVPISSPSSSFHVLNNKICIINIFMKYNTFRWCLREQLEKIHLAILQLIVFHSVQAHAQVINT